MKNEALVNKMKNYAEVRWLNPDSGKDNDISFGLNDIEDAELRLERFKPFIEKAFPETAESKGIIESELVEIPKMKESLSKMSGPFEGRLFLKKDSHLPVSGSVKARGGIYEVLKFAEKVAAEAGMLKETDDYSILLEERFRDFFSGYSVAVGSTGNLGLSIGIISARLGFKVTVHMSADARQWKKDLLRSKGVTVIEYPDDYQKAVCEGRKEAENDPKCHFVDDEGSTDLFFGYSVSAKRIGKQFEANGIICDDDHPVFVYIPCGVGGAPGGIAFGLKTIYGKNVHIYFAEPTHAPCMTLGLATGLNDGISCRDVGIDGLTQADGLAVGRASRLVGNVMKTMLDGCYTISDEKLFPFLSELADTEGIFIEPSSCASFEGPSIVNSLVFGPQYKGQCTDCFFDGEAGPEAQVTAAQLMNATHILWATGGSMVPEEEMKAYYEKGKQK